MCARNDTRKRLATKFILFHNPPTDTAFTCLETKLYPTESAIYSIISLNRTTDLVESNAKQIYSTDEDIYPRSFIESPSVLHLAHLHSSCETMLENGTENDEMEKPDSRSKRRRKKPPEQRLIRRL